MISSADTATGINSKIFTKKIWFCVLDVINSKCILSKKDETKRKRIIARDFNTFNVSQRAHNINKDRKDTAHIES